MAPKLPYPLNGLQGRTSHSIKLQKNIDALYHNIAIFNQVRSFCKENLETELEKLRKEAAATVEYLTSKSKFYEAAVLVNLMVASPSSYTTKSIEARNFDRVTLESPYLGTLIENEKNCGRLFHHIKSATTLSANRSRLYKSALQYSDIQDAQAILQMFIEERLRGTLVQPEGEVREYTSTVYHKIDPLEHRACLWGEENGQMFLRDFDATTMREKRNLLGETGLCVASKRGFDSPELGMVRYRSVDSMPETATDVRGGDVILASVLAGRWNTVADIVREAPKPRTSAFFSHAEVPGLERIWKAFPDLHSNHWACLDPYQLATLMGNLEFINRAEVVAPDLFAKTYTRHHNNEDNSIYGYLSGTFPELTLGEYHPVILSALAGFTDITRYHLERNPDLSKLQTSSWDGKLGALFLIAFKRGDLELLDLLNEVAPFELSNGERVVLSRQAAELAAPTVFQTWMNLAWFDLGGFTWGADPVRCELWRAILESLCSRYEGTQESEDRGIQNDKTRFMEVIWAMEQSMYLARCGCQSCQEYYLKAHQTLGTFDQSG